MTESDDQLPSLEQLQQRIDKAKGLKGKGKRDSSSSSGQNADQAMRLGVELVSGVAVGSIAGFLLDRWLHTLPLFFIICFFLGAAAGFRNMVREAGRTADHTEKKE